MQETMGNTLVNSVRLWKCGKKQIQFLANQQIDWQAVSSQSNPILDADGNISGYEAAKSHYVLYEDRTDDKTMVATSIFNTQLNENLIINAGGSFRI
jgi:hypothetical protein